MACPHGSGNKVADAYYDVADRVFLAVARVFVEILHHVLPKSVRGLDSVPCEDQSSEPSDSPCPVPNALSVASFATGMYAAVKVLDAGASGSRAGAAALLMLAYFFDTADGMYARRYGCVSVLGDIIDHSGDIAKTIGLGYALVVSSGLGGAAYLRDHAPGLAANFALLFAAMASLGCMQVAQGGNEKEILGGLKTLCPCDGEGACWKGSIVGCGVWSVALSALVASRRI